MNYTTLNTLLSAIGWYVCAVTTSIIFVRTRAAYRGKQARIRISLFWALIGIPIPLACMAFYWTRYWHPVPGLCLASLIVGKILVSFGVLLFALGLIFPRRSCCCCEVRRHQHHPTPRPAQNRRKNTSGKSRPALVITPGEGGE